ncbi:fructose-1-phosphate kinase PfkB-like protein [Mycoplasmoides fastidiosum]|uniref:Fructose-1-phosphate kinase PfkB-like protein n=1 Tax=Mycoplasmoides fastidiosum TaxID=92758 RepID=A0ABU0LZC1_9BACT|nr:PfkB family carbohydrate kinase [Mycoplasmoides fastidiosum]MDQ0514051.1 fructose-1-phosphate kinase PfkB-like protein [Mycoplasmoides fastidiosum]UUD37538.1 PfkB family carbohydrate kinase [Mycoplasmoides fastidiosum]
MFYTITLSPAVDYIYKLNKPITIGTTNRASFDFAKLNKQIDLKNSSFGVPYIVYGGKGVNVSLCSLAHQIPSKALVLTNDPNQGYVCDWIKTHPQIAEQFVWFEALLHLRVNAKIMFNQTMTEINDQNFMTNWNWTEKILNYLETHVKTGDFISVNGNLPVLLDDQFQILGVNKAAYVTKVEEFIRRLHQIAKTKNAQIISDSNLLVNSLLLKEITFLFKPNLAELDEFFDKRKVKLREEFQLTEPIIDLAPIYQEIILKAISFFKRFRIKFLLISLGADGAVLVHANQIIIGRPNIRFQKEPIIGFQGCGDTMLGAFVSHYLQIKSDNIMSLDNLKELLVYAMAAGAAKALTFEIPDLQFIDQIYQKYFADQDKIIIHENYFY